MTLKMVKKICAPLCNFRSGCRFGPECHFAHGEHELVMHSKKKRDFNQQPPAPIMGAQPLGPPNYG